MSEYLKRMQQDIQQLHDAIVYAKVYPVAFKATYGHLENILPEHAKKELNQDLSKIRERLPEEEKVRFDSLVKIGE